MPEDQNMKKVRLLTGIGLVALLAGCTSLDTRTEVQSVGAMVQERTGAEVRWRLSDADAQAIQEAVKARLEKPLTAESAVQVALLASPQAQRMLDQLDIAVAERTQAGLLTNPVLDFAYLKPRNQGSTGLEFGLGFELLGALTLPVREKIAQSEYEAGKLGIAESLVALASSVRRAFYEAQAAQMALAYWEETGEAAAAASELADSLHKAGNLSALKRQRQQLLSAEAAMQAAQASTAAQIAREKLNRLMGLWGKEATQWRMAGNLPGLPNALPDERDLEQRVLNANLRLKGIRALLDAQAERLGLARNTAFLPELDAGYAWNREVGDGAWNSGPTLGLRLPLFDTGEARQQKLRGEFRVLERDFTADSIALRTEARARSLQLSSQFKAAQQAQTILGPLAQQITQESVLHFNAMQIGLFELLQDRRRETETAIKAIAATRDYWLARNDLDSLLAGAFPDNFSEAAAPRMSGAGETSGGH
jgi:outer membrane protein, heavy metal efflux system